MKTERAIEPDLFKIMEHKNKFINDFKMNLIRKYVDEANKPYINVIDLNCYMILFNKYKIFLFNGTGFQLGPGMVYMFLKSKFFQLNLLQSVTPMSKFYQRISHKLYTSTYFPYWLSACLLYGEVSQLMHDMVVWNNKVFGSSLSYNLKTEADKKLLMWRNWFSQFYEGCHEFEKKKDNLEW